ncbi:uncharacterized protein LOC121628128 isoform X2 [Melanotaenia boesemani]|uniref:uncharacterized protein LOC121628128 isoform X2 n=1 Tax=Melanotaenia boesemani TaxID=1250792 RepID=UPI001C04C9BD|nr:uncharacterized protein LOC121628128 isoform X2 [Melanotaenia boesemani]
MAVFPWILSLICAAGCHLSSPSPVLRSALVVQTGQNVSLTCNITPSTEITWYLLRSDQLLPLLTIKESNFIGRDSISFHVANKSRISWSGDLQGGLVSLEILAVEEEDAGLYFCAGRIADTVHVNKGIHLKVNGEGETTVNRRSQPCWNLGICVLPGVLALCFIIVVGLCLCSGKPAVCSCNPGWSASLRVAEEESLQYSSLRHPHKLHPAGRGRPKLVEEPVTYSTVASRKNLNALHDH